MHHSSVASIAAVSIFTFVQAASAADLPAKAPVPAPAIVAYNWTGFYLGGNVGIGGNRRSVDYTPNDPAAFSFLTGIGHPPPASFNTFGAIGGGQLGYNWQYGSNWLIGVEADFNWSGMKGNASSSRLSPVVVDPTQLTASFEERIKWFGTVRARLGFLPTDRFLTYVTGGFAYGRVERSATITGQGGPVDVNVERDGFSIRCFIPTTCLAGSSSDIAMGWTAGGGFEYALGANFTVKTEYLYVKLDSDPLSVKAVTVPSGSPASANANPRTDFHIVRGGLNYRF